jgi:hypothetical protein
LSIRGFLRPTLAIVFSLVASAALGACSPQAADSAASVTNMAPMSAMPADVQAAPVAVRQAYQFAVANPDVVKGIPCYCGCGAEGHTSNYSCYIAGQDPDGGLRFDQHALGCSICVDITRDAMGMLGQGKTLPEIRAAIDQTYSRYGPSNMP